MSGTYLPNLVGGVSIWRLAHDLNEAKFFDGRLLVPDTEGSDSLPVKVTWHVDGLVPLREARASHAADVDRAIAEFLSCVKAVAREFDDPKSGYNKYAKAFSVPTLAAPAVAEGVAENYYLDPATKKLCVINWGASPRTLGGKQELVFGYGSFDKLFAGAALAEAAASVGAGAAGEVDAPAGEAPAAEAEKPKTAEKKDGEKKKEAAATLGGKPWWVWALVAIAIAALLAAMLLLARGCDDLRPAPLGDAGADAAALDGGADASATDAGADAATDDAGADAAVDDAGADAAADDAGPDAAAADAGADAAAGDGGAPKDAGDGDGKAGEGSGAGAGSGDGAGEGAGLKLKVVPGGPDVALEKLPHREQFHPDAVQWKVASGEQFLAAGSPRTGHGPKFLVVLKPGNTFEQVTVLWQDRRGTWHQ